MGTHGILPLAAVLAVMVPAGSIANEGRSVVLGAEPPDLAVAWTAAALHWSVTPEAVEGRLRGRLLVSNFGGDAAASEVAILLSADEVPDPGDAVLGRVPIPAVRGGQSAVVALNLPLPPSPPPPVHHLVAVADPDGALGEAVLANNAAARGPFTSGEELFPQGVGDAGFFRGVERRRGVSDRPFFDLAQWSAPTLFLGAPAQALLRTDADGTGVPRRDFFDRDARAVRFLGSDDAADLVTPQVTPYDDVLFPFRQGLRWQSIPRKELDLGEDLDDDGVFETAVQTTTMSVQGPFEVVTPLGAFPGCLRKQESVRLVLKSSRTGRRVALRGTLRTWRAPGVGEVRRSWAIRVGSRLDSAGEEELLGYAAGSAGAGLVSDLPLATGLAPANSDLGVPGQPVVDADPEGFLLLTLRQKSPSDGNLVAVRLSRSGLSLGETVLAPAGVNGSVRAAAAFDGSNHLVAHDAEGRIRILRIATDGGLVDAAPGAEISTGASNFYPAVASDGTGWLVAWAHFDGTGYDIRGALVASDGTTGGEFPLYTAQGEQVFPRAAFDGTNFLVVWRDTPSGSGPSADTDLRGARISPAGTVLDAGGILLAGGPGTEEAATLAGGNGSCLLAWNHFDGQSATGLRVARIATDGTPIDGTGTGVEAVPPGLGVVLAAAAFDGSRWLLVAVRPEYFPPNGVFAVSIPGEGPFEAPASLAATVSISATPPRNRFALPAVAWDGAKFLCAWMDAAETQDTEKGILGALLFPGE